MAAEAAPLPTNVTKLVGTTRVTLNALKRHYVYPFNAAADPHTAYGEAEKRQLRIQLLASGAAASHATHRPAPRGAGGMEAGTFAGRGRPQTPPSSNAAATAVLSPRGTTARTMSQRTAPTTGTLATGRGAAPWAAAAVKRADPWQDEDSEEEGEGGGAGGGSHDGGGAGEGAALLPKSPRRRREGGMVAVVSFGATKSGAESLLTDRFIQAQGEVVHGGTALAGTPLADITSMLLDFTVKFPFRRIWGFADTDDQRPAVALDSSRPLMSRDTVRTVVGRAALALSADARKTAAAVAASAAAAAAAAAAATAGTTTGASGGGEETGRPKSRGVVFTFSPGTSARDADVETGRGAPHSRAPDSARLRDAVLDAGVSALAADAEAARELLESPLVAHIAADIAALSFWEVLLPRYRQAASVLDADAAAGVALDSRLAGRRLPAAAFVAGEGEAERRRLVHDILLQFVEVDKVLAARKRTGYSHTRPVLLLCLRTVVESLLRALFPFHFLVEAGVAEYLRRYVPRADLTEFAHQLAVRTRAPPGAAHEAAHSAGDGGLVPRGSLADSRVSASSLITLMMTWTPTFTLLDSLVAGLVDTGRFASTVPALAAASDAQHALGRARRNLRRWGLVSRLVGSTAASALAAAGGAARADASAVGTVEEDDASSVAGPAGGDSEGGVGSPAAPHRIAWKRRSLVLAATTAGAPPAEAHVPAPSVARLVAALGELAASPRCEEEVGGSDGGDRCSRDGDGDYGILDYDAELEADGGAGEDEDGLVMHVQASAGGKELRAAMDARRPGTAPRVPLVPFDIPSQAARRALSGAVKAVYGGPGATAGTRVAIARAPESVAAITEAALRPIAVATGLTADAATIADAAAAARTARSVSPAPPGLRSESPQTAILRAASAVQLGLVATPASAVRQAPSAATVMLREGTGGGGGGGSGTTPTTPPSAAASRGGLPTLDASQRASLSAALVSRLQHRYAVVNPALGTRDKREVLSYLHARSVGAVAPEATHTAAVTAAAASRRRQDNLRPLQASDLEDPPEVDTFDEWRAGLAAANTSFLDALARRNAPTAPPFGWTIRAAREAAAAGAGDSGVAPMPSLSASESSTGGGSAQPLTGRTDAAVVTSRTGIGGDPAAASGSGGGGRTTSGGGGGAVSGGGGGVGRSSSGGGVGSGVGVGGSRMSAAMAAAMAKHIAAPLEVSLPMPTDVVPGARRMRGGGGGISDSSATFVRLPLNGADVTTAPLGLTMAGGTGGSGLGLSAMLSPDRRASLAGGSVAGKSVTSSPGIALYTSLSRESLGLSPAPAWLQTLHAGDATLASVLRQRASPPPRGASRSPAPSDVLRRTSVASRADAFS